uniref:Aryl hydrocarbon receptor n=1 Tax=Salarias fasciatus TaxID=181472 RepID=A0A672IND3_SALFA
MLGNPGTYANKKRKKPVLKQKKISDGNEVVKSNPSKRHRDRLNGELDRLMDLLPFSEEVRSRLDKLSVLRLSVGYLRVKSHFRATIKANNGGLAVPGVNGQSRSNVEAAPLSEGELLMQALNGFVMVVTSDGLVFYSSPTIKDYLGFHQSDVIHQSVFDLIHTDDRSMFREQLHFALNPPPLAGDGDAPQGGGGPAVTYRPEQLPPENSSFLERSFVCRFRCLLDNSSGFLALKFQGRLRYLHSQSVASGSRPQLALFAMAVPVQQPSIVEIRAKMLLFQSKHGLDFTPMGIDSRGKIILGYSEVELCMKGSGYQFIHAADMMYCADNHIRMIKTGESGLTVFRLLTKSGSWVWVKSNAKLIFKGGRPDFIIAYQRALTNPEGEAYLRQRRLQLPFSFTTGEGVLYNTTPTVDLAQLQFNKMFQDETSEKKLTPTSLLDCFLSQDEAIYSQTAEAPLPVDQVFMESRALLSVASNSWQDAADAANGGAVVKEEAKQSVTVLIDSLEKMADSGDLSSVLQNLDVDDAALMELEAALNSMSQGEEQPSAMTSDLGGLLTNDMFDYIDSVLFKDKAEDCLSAVSPSCLGVGQEDAPMTPPFSEACQPHLFQTAKGGAPNGLYPQQQAANGGGVVEPAPMFTQKLSHQGPLMAPPTGGLPPIQQLQLQDIFSPSIELPQLTVPPPRLQPHGAAAVRPAGQLLPHADVPPPLIPSKDSSSPHIPVRLSVSCGQESLQAWPQGPQGPPQTLPQNRHDKMLSFHHSDSQAFFPGGVPGLNHVQQQRGGPAGAQPDALSSCMFSGPALGGVTAHPGSAGLQGGTTYQDQSPPQGSCYYQWGHNEPVVGTAVINQEDASVSPLSAASSSQLHMDSSRLLQVTLPPVSLSFFSQPPRMEREIDRRIGAAAAVMRSLYRSVVVKKELS